MDLLLINQITELKNRYKPAESMELQVSYYPYKNINHTIRIRQKIIFIRLSDKIRSAPDEIQLAVVRLLLDKLFRAPIDKKIRHSYLNYINKNIVPNLQQRLRKATDHYIANGRFFNLERIFDQVNKQYFNDSVTKPKIGWSMQNSRRRLAFYDHERDLLVISRIFDSRRTPAEVVEFLMFHEMLHIRIPVARENGRRVIHSREFRLQEKKFKEYEKVQKWLEKRMWKLRF